jgi:RHS repeat-associated protein
VSNPQRRDGENTIGTGNNGAPPKSFQIAAPTINLPKGGGAIKGIGEKFAANPVTGTGYMTVPIATSPCRSGFGPQLGLSYDSGAGNGSFGFGWQLPLPSITRKTDKGLPQYRDMDESDVFLLSGAEDLVPEFEKDASGDWILNDGKPVVYDKPRTVDGITYCIRRYRPRVEGLFARIERWTNSADSNDVHWRSITRDNILNLYGLDGNARIADPEHPAHIFSWLICESRDDKGNAILYEYKPEDGAGVDLTHVHERNRGERNDPRRTANRYLKRIKYGNRTSVLAQDGNRPPFLTAAQIQNARWMFEVVLDYGEHNLQAPTPDEAGTWDFRNDPFSIYRSGFEVRTTRLCQHVFMFHHIPDLSSNQAGYEGLVRSTDFDYSYERNPADARNPIYSFLISVTGTSYRKESSGYVKRSLPPVDFHYTEPTVQETVEEVDGESLENLPIGMEGSTYQWTDLHGEGIPGILTEQAGSWFYKRNVSPINIKLSDGIPHTEAKFAPVETVALRPNLILAGGQARFMDLAGDGQPDLAVLDGPMPGLYEHDQEEGWQSFRPFTSRLNYDMRDPNMRLVDLDGDGHADVLITEENAIVWHASKAEEGFGTAQRVAHAWDEEEGPRLVFADGTQSVYLADLNGDNLTDLVRIRNGEVCYWPNLGYGRFGAKITMDQAPVFDQPDLFDHKRICLADIDGTGTTDIIYLHRDGVRLYFNQSGNSWSQPQILGVFPRIDDRVNIAPTDLLGNGTACLVWSSSLPGDARRHMRYVNLMGEGKPHLLIKTVNNLGAETRVTYAPSTKFYLQDKKDGKPWITRLPFPVQVVERVETYDRISRNRFVSRYNYHHGYFNGEEREFRGFGMVEQVDTEEIGTIKSGDTHSMGTNLDEGSFVPPVLTKTWFHTGAYIDRDHVSDFYGGLLDVNDVGEYYREPGLVDEQARRLLLDDTILPDGLTDDEEREACRALKGAMLRQEVYALDGTSKAEHPYVVTEQNMTIRLLQPADGNRHAVFFTYPRESIGYHYERNPADPRIAHSLTLEVDEFGNVLKSAAVAYGRRQNNPVLETRDQAMQSRNYITYGENHITNVVEGDDDYRLPLPCEAQTYELTGLNLVAGQSRFGHEQLLIAGSSASPIEYQVQPTAAAIEKRLIEHLRILFRQNDLVGPLPVGQLESLAVPFESYKLAFTAKLLDQVYARNGQPLLPNPADVLQGGGTARGSYVDLDQNGHWWIASGRIYLSPDTSDSAAQELAYARQHFFLPHRYRNPFHTETVSTEDLVIYDQYDLLIVETRDALDNSVAVEANDYRVLQARRIADPNGNRMEVAFDVLGLVVGTAVMGKPLPAPVEGDTLTGFVADLTQPQIDAFLAQPREAGANPRESVASQIVHELLGNATTRIVYDLNRYSRLSEPPYAAIIERETHGSDLLSGQRSKIQIKFSYSDGFGREIQKKIQAEPGTVPQRDVNGRIILGADGQPIMTPNEVSPRWVGSGWTIFNNKGKPIRQYEPYFTHTHLFEFEVKIGVTPVLFYDPVERVVATLHPNHTWEKVVFDSWRQERWDVNDTLLITDPKSDPDVGEFFKRLADADYLPSWYGLRTDLTNATTFAARYSDAIARTNETQAARKTEVHADTPSVGHADSLGRTFITVAHDKFKYSDTSGPPDEEFHATRIILDIEGNQREVIDAKDRIVMRYDYDMLGTRIHEASMEAGERWMLNNVAGKPLYTWDTRGHQFRSMYDQLRRPTESFLREGTGTEILIAQTLYGERRSNPEADNLRGKVIELRDQAGIVTTDLYDFKGNLLHSVLQLAADYKSTVNWLASPTLEAETFTSSTTYDTLNRPVTATSPDGSIYRPRFNEANLLEEVNVNLRGAAAVMHFVTDIDYNAKGQRVQIEHGNGVRTTYEYDPLTLRLVHLKTLRGAKQLQDLSYTYDPTGNVTHIQDDAQQTIYFNNGLVEPHNTYTYDAIYRLIEATGREHVGQVSAPETTWNDEFRVHLSHPQNGQAMRPYTERYEYDAVGNFEKLRHMSVPFGLHQNGSWTRWYDYNEASLLESGKQSNRLSSTTVGRQTGNVPAEVYPYDSHGNMLAMPHLPHMDRDFNDQLQHIDLLGGGEVFYVYDAGGQRIRKVIEKNAGTLIEERLYLGGFEVFRRRNGSGTITLKRDTLHVMDVNQRIALVETKTVDTSSPLTAHPQLIRYQFGNHLGSASLELDAEGQIISYEEYYPYGSTSYQAGRSEAEVSLKWYRYIGMERDEETGLNYHGARYYAPWLGRWIRCDPYRLIDGANVYRYAHCRPINFVDPEGTEPKVPPIEPIREGMLIGDSPGLSARWQRAVEGVLKRRYGGGSYAENMNRFQQELQRLPRGSNRTPGSAINLARRVFGLVNRSFRKVVPLPSGSQIHHAFEGLAKNPGGSLNATGLEITTGQARNPATTHGRAHRASELLREGVQNPGLQATQEMEAARFTNRASTASSERVMIEEELNRVATKHGLEVRSGEFTRVGSRLYTALKVGGTVVLLYQASQIRSLGDAIDFAAQTGVSYGSFAVGKAITGSTGVGFIVSMTVTMPSDQGPPSDKQLQQWKVSDFLYENYSQEEIDKGGDALRKEAHKLLFDTKPFRFVPPPIPLETLRQMEVGAGMSPGVVVDGIPIGP